MKEHPYFNALQVKFAYSYKMSDGVRREGTIDAPSRDEAFATLRKDGIRPIKMFAAEDPDAAAAAARARTRRGVFIGIGVGILIAAVLGIAGILIYRKRDNTKK